MIDRTTKLRWRRTVRRRQRQIEDIGSHTEESLDKHFFRRLGRLYEVRRFLLAWILLIVALIGALVVQTRALGDYYLKLVPIAGGVYSEGIVGTYTNANPIFASSDVDASVSRLLFSGLLSYDADNHLTPELAEKWSVDETGKIYTVNLKQDIRWHDGRPLTAEDVVFTFKTIQNPDARSPFFASWQGIKVASPDEYTVEFTLPNVLASFPHSLTSGIIPKHLLKDVPAADLRGSLFNTIEPVGTGPFRWGGVEVVGDTPQEREQRIALSAYDQYHKGRPKLSEFIIRAFLEEPKLIKSFESGELNAVVGVQSMPLHGEQAEELRVPLTGSVMVFFRTTQPALQDSKVRRALTMATNRGDLLRQISQPAIPVGGPLLPEHLGYNENVLQQGLDIDAAAALLDEAGWHVDQDSGMRQKDGEPLSLTLYTLNSAEYAAVAKQLQRQWRSIGVNLSVNSMAQRDLQTVIDERSYDLLMYGILMGLDPDQFAYWHSSQADVRSQRRLNFSDYNSTDIDEALEAGRTRIDPELRAAKYLPFLETWKADAPAIALYRPRFTYTTYTKVYNLDLKSINSPTDRFNKVEQWMVRTDRAVVD